MQFFLVILSFTNISLFWIIKLPHVFLILLTIKYKLYRYSFPKELYFFIIVLFFYIISTIINPNINFFIDAAGLFICMLIYALCFIIARNIFDIKDLCKYFFLSAYYTSLLALFFQAFEFLTSYDIRLYFGLNREIKAEYFGILRNSGLATEPGNFAYYYLSISGFIFAYLKNNLTTISIFKFLVIIASFILTFSAGGIAILILVNLILIFLKFRRFLYYSLSKTLIFFIFLFMVFIYFPIEFIEPIIGKVTLSGDYKSSSIRYDTLIFGLSNTSVYLPFGNGPGFIDLFYEHSLYNWFLGTVVEYGYFSLFFILLIFLNLFIKIYRMKNFVKYDLLFMLLSIFFILNIVGVYNSPVYWVVLGFISGISSKYV